MIHPIKYSTFPIGLVSAVSKELNRVSRVALEAMRQGVEEVQELIRSGYYVRLEAVARDVRLSQRIHR